MLDPIFEILYCASNHQRGQLPIEVMDETNTTQEAQNTRDLLGSNYKELSEEGDREDYIPLYLKDADDDGVDMGI